MLALACLAVTPATAQRPLKVGMSDKVNTVLPLGMPQAGGFFATSGLKIEIGAGSTKLADYIDLALIEDLRRKGFLAAMERKYGTR